MAVGSRGGESGPAAAADPVAVRDGDGREGAGGGGAGPGRAWGWSAGLRAAAARFAEVSAGRGWVGSSAAVVLLFRRAGSPLGAGVAVPGDGLRLAWGQPGSPRFSLVPAAPDTGGAERADSFGPGRLHGSRGAMPSAPLRPRSLPVPPCGALAGLRGSAGVRPAVVATGAASYSVEWNRPAAPSAAGCPLLAAAVRGACPGVPGEHGVKGRPGYRYVRVLGAPRYLGEGPDKGLRREDLSLLLEKMGLQPRRFRR